MRYLKHTAKHSQRQSVAGRPSAFCLQPSAFTQPAFTLVEMLVVITIIAVLAALLLPAISNARKSARQTAIKAELSTLETAIETYKNDVSGGSYPPDAMVGILGNSGNEGTIKSQLFSDFKRHFKKAFPRHREDEELLRGLIGVGTGASLANPNLEGGMTPSEALVFWLQRFSSDPKYPISGEGGPSFDVNDIEELGSRNWILDNPEQSLRPRADDGTFGGRFIQYQDPRVSSVTRQINFWEYHPADSPRPAVYFDASRGLHDIDHQVYEAAGIEIHPLKQLKSGTATASQYFMSNIRLANEGKFQLLHAGIDEEWGDFEVMHIDPTLTLQPPATTTAVNSAGNPFPLYPDGPFTLEMADTITNFAPQATLEDSQP